MSPTLRVNHSCMIAFALRSHRRSSLSSSPAVPIQVFSNLLCCPVATYCDVHSSSEYCEPDEVGMSKERELKDEHKRGDARHQEFEKGEEWKRTYRELYP